MRIVRRLADEHRDLESRDERWVRHLGGVAVNHMISHLFRCAAFGAQQHPHAFSGAGALEQTQLLGGQRLRVVVAPRALPLGHGPEQWRGPGSGGLQRHAHDIACRVETRFALEPVGQRGLDQVLSAAQPSDFQRWVLWLQGASVA